MKRNRSFLLLVALLSLVSCKGMDNRFIASNQQVASDCQIEDCVDKTLNPRQMYASTAQPSYIAKTNQDRIEVSGQCETSNVTDTQVRVKFGSQILVPYTWYKLNVPTGKIISYNVQNSVINDNINDDENQVCTELNKSEPRCVIQSAGRNKYSTSEFPDVYFKIELSDYYDYLSRLNSPQIRCRNGKFKFLVDVRGVPWGVEFNLWTDIVGYDENLNIINSANSPISFNILKDNFCIGRTVFAKTDSSLIFYDDANEGKCFLNYQLGSGAFNRVWYSFLLYDDANIN